ncbi:MAG: hypothetical protein EZS28_008805 [Streblomastix strix]|uniref:Dynein heavy chain AAA module D4 domain-containing protein n=1 Tax=Streblomastix strix TaxID=222440 RepID=A0A5J4WM17_9EUKA|nr:MAG: hypothetical protein EZS28_008805 [Streblomastix strix]
MTKAMTGNNTQTNANQQQQPMNQKEIALRYATWYAGQPQTAVYRRLSIGPSNPQMCTKQAQRSIERYESAVRDINAVLFPEYVDYMSRIDRLLAWPGQGILLVGKCGVGRRTLLQLVSHSHGMRVMTPTVGRCS